MTLGDLRRLTRDMRDSAELFIVSGQICRSLWEVGAVRTYGEGLSVYVIAGDGPEPLEDQPEHKAALGGDLRS